MARDLAQLWSGKLDTAALLARIGSAPAWAQRRTPSVRTEVVVDNAVSRKFTLVDIFTKDRLGLLHDVARTLHEAGLSIAFSKVNTEGDKAMDVFYVVDGDGQKIVDRDETDALIARLRALLSPDATEERTP